MSIAGISENLGRGRQLIVAVANPKGNAHWVLLESIVENGGQKFIRLFDPSNAAVWEVPFKLFQSKLAPFGGHGILIGI